ncbi:phosphoribosylanthranilate isomerase [Paludisphaera borealis]|uniref:N-(5'-phosphoribosyl)anthranilate isomerase n=1 Tax=Paludisphaera borealis TaxID=1387353 RepID=A0A1U7CR60_9BACT|nr:phosphoribosylanthranilate isomerase [Paludisphaera borealis]APW61363.1 N-(5'-phosphoribosyl)anthranilate isomerase [Paludisphaera borealis]
MFRQSPGIKVCGLTEPANALDCLQAGADWIGLNFHPASPRFVTVERAETILSALPTRAVAVGLFVNRPADEVREVCARLGLTRVQLHGDEPVEDVVALSEFFVIRAFRLRDASAVAAMSAYLERADRLGRSPDAVLIDAWSPGRAGGTGELIDDDLMDGLPPLPRLMLAGGLTADNVAARAARVRPWMVDAASGVESSPGVKDLDKVRAFVRAAAR